MAGIDKFKGDWRADVPRWLTLDAGMNELGAAMAEMMIGGLQVKASDTQFVVEGLGKQGAKTYTYTVRSDSGSKVVLDVLMGGDPNKKGVYEVEFVDDNTVTMTLTEPKKDVMALKRA